MPRGRPGAPPPWPATSPRPRRRRRGRRGSRSRRCRGRGGKPGPGPRSRRARGGPSRRTHVSLLPPRSRSPRRRGPRAASSPTRCAARPRGCGPRRCRRARRTTRTRDRPPWRPARGLAVAVHHDVGVPVSWLLGVCWPVSPTTQHGTPITSRRAPPSRRSVRGRTAPSLRGARRRRRWRPPPPR